MPERNHCMNLLIADDEFTIRRGLLSLPWSTIGITRIFDAENGLRAKDILNSEHIDIIISDIRMPGLSGLELAEYVKESGLDCRIILLTGFSEFEYAQQAIKSQVADYLLKPLKQADLLNAVAHAITQLEKNRYERQIVQQHETEQNEFSMALQVSSYFRMADRQLMPVLQDMAENYTQDVSLNDYAEKYHFSVSSLSRLFKRGTGYNFIDLLNAMRILHSIFLLENSGERIGDISALSGFRDTRYFSQLFRKVTGCTPREYRSEEQNRKNYNLLLVLEQLKENR